MPERRITVQARVETTVPDDLGLIIQVPREAFPFRPDRLMETLDETGTYGAWVTGPKQTKSGRDHARQQGYESYFGRASLPAELQPLALGPAGLRGILAEVARGGDA